ncbi:MAG: hypothetical protein Q8N99_01705 [Nanoarchaeota archaeon]|nr:hypothetical protein [Nanoarchaeota archaeon]
MRKENERKAILNILKSPEKEYNANNLSKVIGITSMGILKILRSLLKEDILSLKKVSNINFYKINFSNPYSLDYSIFLLKDEAEHTSSYAKRWVLELRKIKSAEIGIIFGSVLSKKEKANDIDVLFVVKKENLSYLKKEIEKLNIFNDKKIHAVYQTREDFSDNLIKNDIVLLDAIKGIVVFGEKEYVELLGGIK